MTNILIFILSFYFLLFSTIGYGIFFNNLCFGKDKNFYERSIFIGFYGLFSITFISLITSIFLAHTFIHNLFLHFLGILLLFFTKADNKLKYLKFITLISITVFSALLISKTHDDFSYYHLPFTKYLTEHNIIFGMGNLNHGYNYVSSLFFLNSTFYLPFIEYYSFHFSLIFFLIFFNFFLIKEIIDNEHIDVVKFLYIFTFIFFNLSFNRLAEYGTDKAGQLLIVILIIKLFHYIYYDKENTFKNILFLTPLLAFCISFKTYFLPYILLGLLIILPNLKNSKLLKELFYSKSFIFFLCLLLLNFFHHFVSTGCVVSLLPITCAGEALSWARDLEDMSGLSIWLEQWAKAGAGPNFQVNNVSEYIKNFNWVSNWIDKYFLIKFLDQIGLLSATFLITFFLFKKINLKKNFYLDKNYSYFYLIIVIIFFIWFTKHPTLRYGGYSAMFLLVSIPITFFFSRIENKDGFIKKLKILISTIVILFNLKNFNRINNEIEREDLYKFTNFPFYSIKEKEFKKKKYDTGLTIFAAHHCWATPTPCGHLSEKIKVKKKNGFYFISKSK